MVSVAMPVQRKRCTIKEVAARSGVSVATVSNVLQNKSHLYSPETAERVWQAVRELGYRPSSVARSLIRQRTDTIGVILEERQELVLDPYVMGVLEGMLEYTVPRNYPIKIVSMLYQQSPDSFLAHVDDGSVDGVVLVAPRTYSAALQWAQESGYSSGSGWQHAAGYASALCGRGRRRSHLPGSALANRAGTSAYRAHCRSADAVEREEAIAGVSSRDAGCRYRSEARLDC
jgi:transcriptional regulator with XRE-family HTH domain